MSTFFQFSENIEQAAAKALQTAGAQFAAIDTLTEYNQQKVLAAFIKHRVNEADFGTTTGYGYNDCGREKLDVLTADIFGAESALIRAGALACGTHTLSVCLYGVLRPSDVMLSVTGLPYDTIHSTIGLDGEKSRGKGTLKDFGVLYRQVDLTDDDELDYEKIETEAAKPDVRMVYIQRSRGYSLRHSISVAEIERVCEIVHRVNKNAVVMVDNCYGEFTEEKEPTEVGADLMAGSLIKNVRGSAPKTAVFAAALFANFGYAVTPAPAETRHDIIQAICLRDAQRLIAFCQGLQKGAPVDAYVTPEPWDMPGYDSQVIMAAGTFTAGSSIELSGDAPLREPFAVWMQGGLNFHSGKLGVLLAAQEMENRGLL